MLFTGSTCGCEKLFLCQHQWQTSYSKESEKFLFFPPTMRMQMSFLAWRHAGSRREEPAVCWVTGATAAFAEAAEKQTSRKAFNAHCTLWGPRGPVGQDANVKDVGQMNENRKGDWWMDGARVWLPSYGHRGSGPNAFIHPGVVKSILDCLDTLKCGRVLIKTLIISCQQLSNKVRWCIYSV